MLDVHARAQIAYLDALPRAYSAALEAEYGIARDENLVVEVRRLGGPRRSAASLRKLIPEVAAAIDTKWSDEIGCEWARRMVAVDESKKTEIERVLAFVEIRPGDEWNEASRFSGYQWASQTANGSYAKGRAELDGAILSEHGLEVVIESLPVNKRAERREDRRFWPEFVVRAKADPTSIRAALARGIDDPFAAVWRKGLNPAAMFVGLPVEVSLAAYERSRGDSHARRST